MDQRALYSIGDLARRTGLPVRTIRFCSDAGVLPPTHRSSANHRRYDLTAVARLVLDRVGAAVAAGIDVGGVLRVAVAGEVDVATAPALHAALEHATTEHPAAIEVDVAAVTHFSLARLRVLDDVRRRFGGTLVLLDVGRPVPAATAAGPY